MGWYVNSAVRRDGTFRGLFTDAEYSDVRAYFANPASNHSPTPLTELHGIARDCGIAAIDAKNETNRHGVGAFKILGVSYAVDRIGEDAARRGLVCATAGNHGRAVARVARQRGVPCTIFLPSARTTEPIELLTREARVLAMREDGAKVVEVDCTYEEAVQRAAAFGAQAGATIVSDTSWDGYEQIPRWIMAGYTQLFEEASQQWHARPDVVVVQGGVGGLVCAAASWFAARYGVARPLIVAAEPEHAACLLESARAGFATNVGGTLDTLMAGLRCAEPSPIAWPTIASGVDAFVTVTDAQSLDTMSVLAAGAAPEQISAGPSGVCGLAAVREIARDPRLTELNSFVRAHAHATDPTSAIRALVVITEGAGG